MNKDCPCGSAKSYLLCCGRFHNGSDIPKSAEALMRSRYSAFAVNNLDYIINTMAGKASRSFVREASENARSQTQWLGLDVVNSVEDLHDPDRAFVEFRALFSVHGKVSVMRELSEFARVDGRWFYVDGKTGKGSINDPCPCHSGKKLKKCHGRKEN